MLGGFDFTALATVANSTLVKSTCLLDVTASVDYSGILMSTKSRIPAVLVATDANVVAKLPILLWGQGRRRWDVFQVVRYTVVPKGSDCSKQHTRFKHDQRPLGGSYINAWLSNEQQLRVVTRDINHSQ